MIRDGIEGRYEDIDISFVRAGVLVYDSVLTKFKDKKEKEILEKLFVLKKIYERGVEEGLY